MPPFNQASPDQAAYAPLTLRPKRATIPRKRRVIRGTGRNKKLVAKRKWRGCHMGGLARRAVVAAGAAVVVVLGPARGAASAARKPITLAFTPSPYGYGQVTAGQTATQTFTLANTGGKASGALTITLPGSAAFTITADTCKGSLGPGKTCTVTVQFAPAGADTASATLTATNNKGDVLASDSLTSGAGHLYWSDVVSGAIMQANLDGSGVTTLITGAEDLNGMAVDNGHIYWTDSDAGTVMEANLDGSGVTTLLSDPNGPGAVAVNSSHIYWSEPGDSSGGAIMEANLDGSGVTTLITGAEELSDIAVDNSHLYWLDDNGPGADGTVMEANLDGTGVTTLVSGLLIPTAITVDSSHIYWVQKGATIMDANLDGTDAAVLLSGPQVTQTFPISVAVSSSHIYWSAIFEPTVKEANLDGTGATALVSFPIPGKVSGSPGEDYAGVVAVGP